MNLVDLLEKLSASMNSPFSVHWTKYSARCLLFFTLGYAVVALAATANRKHYRRGAEHGSARWGNVCRIAKRYRDKKNPKQNLILTQHFQMGMDGHKHKRNTNVVGHRRIRRGQKPLLRHSQCAQLRDVFAGRLRSKIRNPAQNRRSAEIQRL